VAEIILDHITKRFPDGAVAVDDISLDIADGEFIILVGPSGCGKSTTLNMIAGLEDISSGTLRIGDEKVNEAARILDLTPFLDRRPANLSGGQRQRVAMGRAIVRSPRAFLMDEPLSNLDAKLRVQTRTEVSRLQKRLGTTMVYVTHDQTEAMTLGDRVAVMRLGTIQQVASPQELYDRPVNLFVAGFIGSPAMNFMSGTLEDGKLRTALGDITLTGRMRQEVESAGTGREVIVGIRPENFEDASFIADDVKPRGLTFHAEIDVIESLGAEKYVYFTRELGQTANVAELEELARDAGRADIGGNAETVVARLDPATRIHEGQDAELWVDVRMLHVFDPATGRNLSLAARDDADGSTVQAGAASSAAAPSQGPSDQGPSDQGPSEQAPSSEVPPSQSAADPAAGQAPSSPPPPPPPAAPTESAPAGSGQATASDTATGETAPGGEAT